MTVQRGSGREQTRVQLWRSWNESSGEYDFYLDPLPNWEAVTYIPVESVREVLETLMIAARCRPGWSTKLNKARDDLADLIGGTDG